MMEQFNAEEVAQFENMTWSRCAKSYVGGFSALTGQANGPLLDAVKVNKGDRVLDIGTGPGVSAAAAAQRGAEVIGIDFSDAMITEARRNYPEIKFSTSSAESLLYSDKEFDVVVANFVLHHTGRPDQVLAEAFRVLRSGGRVGFTVWGDPSKLEAFGLFFAAFEAHAGAAELPHGPLFGVSDFAFYHRMAREAGFHDSSVKELPIVWQTPSLDPYLASFGDWANLDIFAQDIQAAIQATVRESAAAYQSNGLYTLPNPAILVSAVK